ncbi:hypothetical protein LB542_05160 [Mesorhizobium sp. BR1-1-9]|uniref:hypothetical protein n=1 Tax=unclassified Mesorhizobium TaxID=325217 RepID=UPI001CD126B5|nr:MULTISPECIES: hypothetical protein [unclassified Mesorhizobium]MBZ9870253.1 hypothetical protein [Mesorhizobium sp. BR1-1-9]MBZ9942214.1 hypothetical protein [Mesorhizobium sp. BR1-1-13]
MLVDIDVIAGFHSNPRDQHRKTPSDPLVVAFANDLIHGGIIAIFPKPGAPQRCKLWRQCSGTDTSFRRKIPQGDRALSLGELRSLRRQ